MRRILCLVLAVLCIGCTKLVSTKVTDTSENKGFVYTLKKTGFVGNVTHTLKSCGANPTVAVSVELVPVASPDWEAEYVINYDDWTKINKNFEFKLFLDSIGSIKSVNTSAEDRSFEIAGKALSTAVSIAAAGFGFPGLEMKSLGLGSVLLDKDELNTVCSRQASTTLEEIKEGKNEVKNRLASMTENEKAIIDKLSLAVQQQTNSTNQKNLLKQVEDLRTLNKQIAALVAKENEGLAAKMKAVTLVRLYRDSIPLTLPPLAG
jgi:hypothetical protein